MGMRKMTYLDKRRRVVASLLFAVAVAVAPGPSAHGEAAVPTCMGKSATAGPDGSPGDDVIVATGDTPTVRGGDGNDLICIVDNTAFDGVQIYAGSGNDSILIETPTEVVVAELGPGDDSYIGSDGGDGVVAGSDDGSRDYVRTRKGDDILALGSGRIDADLGKGDDEIYLYNVRRGAGVIDGGRGADSVLTGTDPGARHFRHLRVDLTSNELAVDRARYKLTDFRDAFVLARHVSLRGDNQPNQLQGFGCRVDLHGGAGNDSLTLPIALLVPPEYRNPDCKPRSTQYGDAGNDTLAGGDTVDVLLGGPGRDIATGNAGRDLCRAEQQRSCER